MNVNFSIFFLLFCRFTVMSSLSFPPSNNHDIDNCFICHRRHRIFQHIFFFVPLNTKAYNPFVWLRNNGTNLKSKWMREAKNGKFSVIFCCFLLYCVYLLHFCVVEYASASIVERTSLTIIPLQCILSPIYKTWHYDIHSHWLEH